MPPGLRLTPFSQPVAKPRAPTPHENPNAAGKAHGSPVHRAAQAKALGLAKPKALYRSNPESPRGKQFAYRSAVRETQGSLKPISPADRPIFHAKDVILNTIQHASRGALGNDQSNQIVRELTPQYLHQLAANPKQFTDYVNGHAKAAFNTRAQAESGLPGFIPRFLTNVAQKEAGGPTAAIAHLAGVNLDIPYVDRKLSEFIDRSYYSFPGTVRTLAAGAEHPSQIPGIAKQMGQGVLQVAEHPTEYPIDAALLGRSAFDVGASGALRLARARALTSDTLPPLGLEPAKNLRQALVQRPLMKPPLRTRVGVDEAGNPVQVPDRYSRNPGRFVFQAAKDRGLFMPRSLDSVFGEHAPTPPVGAGLKAVAGAPFHSVRDATKALLRQPSSDVPPSIPGLRSTVSAGKTAALQADQERLLARVAPGGATRKGVQVPIHQRVADTLKRATSTGYFFLKPGYYLPNLAGQALIAGTEYGPKFLKTMLSDTPRMARKLDPETRQLWKAASGVGSAKAMAGPVAAGGRNLAGLPFRAVEKGVSGVHDTLASFYSDYLGLDKPWRMAAFKQEAERQGYKTPEQFSVLLHSPNLMKEFVGRDPALKGTATARAVQQFPDTFKGMSPQELHSALAEHSARHADIAGRSNQAMIDFEKSFAGKGGKDLEKAFRRYAFTGAWFAAATRYGGHLLAEHPTAAEAQLIAGEHERQQAHKGMPFLPSFIQGPLRAGIQDVPGLGKVPQIANMQAASVLGTPAEMLQAAHSLTHFDPQNQYNLANLLQPVYANALAAAEGVNPATGRTLPPGTLGQRFGSLMMNSLPQVQAAKRGAFNFIPGMPSGKGANPQSTLYPMTPRQALARFTLGSSLVPVPVNPVEAESRRRAEIIGGVSKKTGVALNEQWNRTDFLNKYNRVADMAGFPRMKKNDPRVIEGFHHAAVIAQAENQLQGNPQAVDRRNRLTAAGRLAATVVALGEAGLVPKNTVGPTVKQVLALDVNSDVNTKRLRALQNGMYANPAFKNFFDSISAINDFSRKLNHASRAYNIPYAQTGKDLVSVSR